MQGYSSALEDNMAAELKIVLIGKSGSGKSSTGNTILGRNAFPTSSSASSVTQSCQREQATLGKRTVVVVDTPGYFDREWDKKFIKEDMKTCIRDLRPGPHAIIFVIRVGRITPEDKRIINQVKKLFNNKGKYFLVVLFTWIDCLDDITLNVFMDAAGKDLRDLLAMSEGRYVAFNNKAGDDEKSGQVTKLFEEIDNLLNKNSDNPCYTEELFNSDTASCCTVL